MTPEKQTREQRKQAVLNYVRTKLSTGLTPAEIRDRLIAKGFAEEVAQKVVLMASSKEDVVKSQDLVPLSTLTTQDSAPRTEINEDPIDSTPAGQVEDFEIQGRLVKLPSVSDVCTLPDTCVICGKRADPNFVWITEKYSFNTTSLPSAFFRGLVIAILMFVPLFFSASSQELGLEAGRAVSVERLSYAAGGILFVLSILTILRKNKRITLRFPICSSEMPPRKRRIIITNSVAILLAAVVIGWTAAVQFRTQNTDNINEFTQLLIAFFISWPFVSLIEWTRLRALPSFRIATTGASGLFCVGLHKPYVKSLEDSGVQKLEPPFPKPPGFPVSLFFFTFFLTGVLLVIGNLVVMTAKTTAATSAARKEVLNLAHTAGSRGGRYEEVPLAKIWVPDDWNFEVEEKNDSVTQYRLKSQKTVVAAYLQTISNEKIEPYLRSNKNYSDTIVARMKENLSGFEITARTQTQHFNEDARLIESKWVLPGTEQQLHQTVLVSNHNGYSFCIYVTMPESIFKVIGPEKVAEIVNWFEPVQQKQ